MIFDFQEEGVLTILIKNVPLDTTYNWEDSDTIKIGLSLEGESDEIIGEVKINGDRLIITVDGNIETFTRVE